MVDRTLSILVTKITQPVGTFFVGSFDAYALLEVCKFDFRRIDDAGGHKEFLGFQRKLDLKRVRAIERYIRTLDAVFPTAVVISVDERCASISSSDNGVSVLKLQAFHDTETPDFKVEFEDIASIIDGQHRMKAFEEVKGSFRSTSPCSGVRRLHIVRNGLVREKERVLAEWQKTLFLRNRSPETRGWLLDVMKCVESLGKRDFTLDEVYAFERHLGDLYPGNQNVKPKIRQQLQYLRDRGFIEYRFSRPISPEIIGWLAMAWFLNFYKCDQAASTTDERSCICNDECPRCGARNMRKLIQSLVYDLFSLQKSRSSEKTCHEIVVALDEMEESPFYQRIKRLGSATDGRFGETLSQATVVRGLLPYITDDALTDRDIGKRFGFWDHESG